MTVPLIQPEPSGPKLLFDYTPGPLRDVISRMGSNAQGQTVVQAIGGEFRAEAHAARFLEAHIIHNGLWRESLEREHQNEDGTPGMVPAVGDEDIQLALHMGLALVNAHTRMLEEQFSRRNQGGSTTERG